MPTTYKTYSLDAERVESLKKVMEQNSIKYRSDADAVYKAIDKYILDLKLRAFPNINNNFKISEESI